MSDYLKGKRVADPVLTSVARGYKNAALIGQNIFPRVGMEKEGAKVPTFGKGVFATYETLRAVGGKSNVATREKTGTMDIVLDEHDLAFPVDYREQHESMFNEQAKAIKRARNGILLSQEVAAAAMAQNTSLYLKENVRKFTTDDCWKGGKGNPVLDISAGMDAVRNAIGLRPNLMVMGASVLPLLRFHPVLQAVLGANEQKRITVELMQDIFEIEKIVIGYPVKLDNNDKKDAAAKTVDIWRDNLMLYYVSGPQNAGDNGDENEPSFGYTFELNGMPIADTYTGEGGKITYSRYTDIYKMAVVGSDAGYIMTNLTGAK
ncbi:hypothetical protein CE665_19860 [Salmonella enterica subsp. enterica serovar Poona]|nr:hypothetical protein [Salmonella enterica]EBV7096489.1 hypothetical protein [Salmonella enterica subsp. enterica serovar Oranienburg]ECD3767979.1 hypothetical protein [Salmonella enterica subsp. enterica serovar Onderstepoort]ECE9609584.1 hypothetical protein [Salmonella enterica subsp. enterica serovar Enteritidis]EDJ2556601.1 hypothetical protein [Salmonella enterica subsp. enterica serovar Poona]EDV2640181.1 hypothetical protein [Salmonella enterica subsp. salamae]EFT4506929.1 hypotheti